MKFWIDINDCIWQNDFDGNDVGYEDVAIVSFFVWRDQFLLEVNADTLEILYATYMDMGVVQ